MVRSAVWPVGKEKAARLSQFHESSYWTQNKSAARKHEVGSYWLDAVENIRTVVGEHWIKVDSLSSYLGPQQLEELRNSIKTRDGRMWIRTVKHAAMLGKYVRSELWRMFWVPFLFPAKAVLRAHDVANEVRTAELAKEAFLKVHGKDSGPSISFECLKNVPVLAEQSESSLWMVLYISSVINTLSPFMKSFNISRIMEIGPGWGVLAISLHQLFNCQFIMVDLPEVLSATFAMISYYNPESVVVLPNEVEDVRFDGQAEDFILLCPGQTSLIPSDCVDLAINTSGFQEMTYSLIEDYFRLVKRCVRKEGLFYCLNERVFARHRAQEPIEFERYPWDSSFSDIFYEEFAFGRVSGSYERMHRLQVKRAG